MFLAPAAGRAPLPRLPRQPDAWESPASGRRRFGENPSTIWRPNPSTGALLPHRLTFTLTSMPAKLPLFQAVSYFRPVIAMVSYSISQLAREFGITTRTIRFYEDKELLSPARHGQTRVYSAEDRVRLKLILRGKRLGLSLDESREIIDMYDPAGGNVEQLQALLESIEAKRRQLRQQQRDILSLLDELDRAATRTRAALEASANAKE